MLCEEDVDRVVQFRLIVFDREHVVHLGIVDLQFERRTLNDRFCAPISSRPWR